VLDRGLRGQQVDLGKFEMKLANLILTPGRGVELVMRDRRQHEEPGRGRVVALIYPVGAFHRLPARRDRGRGVFHTVLSPGRLVGRRRPARALRKASLRTWPFTSGLASVHGCCWLQFVYSG
jgi:hypothetical protein